MPGSGATSSSPMQRQPQSPRKVDSIASALVGHSLKITAVPLPLSVMSSENSLHRPRPQASSSTSSQRLISSSSNGRTRMKQQHHDDGNDQSLLSLSPPLHHSLATSSWPILHARGSREMAVLLGMQDGEGKILHCICARVI